MASVAPIPLSYSYGQLVAGLVGSPMNRIALMDQGWDTVKERIVVAPTTRTTVSTQDDNLAAMAIWTHF